MSMLAKESTTYYIWRLNMRCPTYSQVTTGQSLRCTWCNEDYNIMTEHWIRYCPARLNKHEADRETTIAILKSENVVAYEEITGRLRYFPLPSLDDIYIYIYIYIYICYVLCISIFNYQA